MGASDIRRKGKIGAESRTLLALHDIVNELPISSTLRRGLSRFSRRHKDFGYFVLTKKSVQHEGRGFYARDKNRLLYSKGIGYMRSLEQNSRKQFGAFREFEGSIFYDDPKEWTADHKVPPRICGTNFRFQCGIEFFHCLEAMVNAIKRYRIRTVKELHDRRVSIPLSVTHFEGLTKYLHKIAKKEKVDLSGQQVDMMQCCSVVQTVPSSVRYSRVFDNQYRIIGRLADGIEFEETRGNGIVEVGKDVSYWVELGKAFRKMLKNGYGLHTPTAAHCQNIFYATKCNTPFADYGDVVPTSRMPEGLYGDFVAATIFRIGQIPFMSVGDSIRVRGALYGGLLNNWKRGSELAVVFQPWQGLAHDIGRELEGLQGKPGVELDVDLVEPVVSRELYNELLDYRMEPAHGFRDRMMEVDGFFLENQSPNPPLKHLLKPLAETRILAYDSTMAEFKKKDIVFNGVE